MGRSSAELPDLPSELLRLGIDCLQACERGRFRVALRVGLRSRPKRAWGLVGLAGSVLYRALGFTEGELDGRRSIRRQVPPVTYRKLLALEAFRRGRVRQALSYLDRPWDGVEAVRPVTPYRVSRDQFYLDLEGIAHALQICGL